MTNILKKSSLADALAEQVREKIQRGEYSQGEKLPTEPELMSLFEVSRSTVREAMRVLANTGWVRIQQGAGTFVDANSVHNEPLIQRLKRGDDEDLEEVRNLLEEKIIEKATKYRTDEDLERMRKALQQRSAFALQQNISACINVDLEFHTCLAKASGNSVLADLYEAFAIRLKQSFSRRFKTVESFKKTQALHEQLLENIERRDASKATEILHIIISL